MTSLLIISLFILAHIMADFLLQTEKIATQKENISNLLLHGAVVGGLPILFTIPYLSFKLLKIILIITFLHLIIDWAKHKMTNKFSTLETSVSFFLGDQLLHLIILLFSFRWLNNIYLHPWSQHLSSRLAHYFPFFNQLSRADWSLFYLLLAAYIFNWRAGNFIVDKTLANFLPLTDQDEQKQIGFTDKQNSLPAQDNIGALIGKLERTLILTLVLTQNFTAITLVFAAKSVARFSNFTDKKFADYYIVGTLSSLSISLIVGILINLIIFYYPASFILPRIFSF
jgi:hypothetical protein